MNTTRKSMKNTGVWIRPLGIINDQFSIFIEFYNGLIFKHWNIDTLLKIVNCKLKIGAVFVLLSVLPLSTNAATITASLKPAFQADLMNTLRLQAGTGNPTFTRATTAYGRMHKV